MTRQRKAVASDAADGNRAILAPLRPSRNLTQEVVQRLQSEIAAGRLVPGARLPTEHGMMVALGVSRTVVREAVAALKAEGLVTTRQGSGAFVAADLGRRGFRIDADGLGSLEQVLQVLELRLAIEVEAAALAATRAPAKAIRRIQDCLKAFEAAIGRRENAVPEDFAFHRAIVEATTNPHFTRLLEFLGHFIIPRQSIRAEGLTEARNTAYLLQIQREHQAIHEAIAAHDGEVARAAMRVHLTRAGERYRAFAGTSRRGGERDGVAAKS
ncbi:MAG: FadR/GntR family transcriptional regulator [Hyphomicrobiaceae bacterium]